MESKLTNSQVDSVDKCQVTMWTDPEKNYEELSLLSKRPHTMA